MPKTDKELTDAIVNKAMSKIRDRKPAPNTNTPILDDDAIAEIEARADNASPHYVVNWSQGGHALMQARGWRPLGEEQPRTIASFDKDRSYFDLLFCAEARADVPALIQTVRALKAERLQMLVALERAQQDRNSWRRTSERLETEKQALQSQLEQLTTERDELRQRERQQLTTVIGIRGCDKCDLCEDHQ